MAEPLTGVLLWVSSNTNKNKYFPLPFDETNGAIPISLSNTALTTIATELTAIRKQGQVDLIAAGSFAAGAMADLNSTAASPYVAAANYNNCYVVLVNGDYTAPQLVTLSHYGLGGTVETWRLGDGTGIDSVGAQIQPGEERIIKIGRVKTSDKLRGKASTTAVRWALYGAQE